MKNIYTTALVLIVIGGVNWGLVGFFNYNLVDMLFGAGSALTRIVYALVGIAALYIIWTLAMPSTKKIQG